MFHLVHQFQDAQACEQSLYSDRKSLIKHPFLVHQSFHLMVLYLRFMFNSVSGLNYFNKIIFSSVPLTYKIK
jgi:hypothetical protein